MPISKSLNKLERSYGANWDINYSTSLFNDCISLSVNRLLPENHTKLKTKAVQLDLFTDYHELRHRQQAEAEDFAKERRRQEAIIKLRKRFGKNAVLKGLNYAEGATQRERNQQIGGHKA